VLGDEYVNCGSQPLDEKSLHLRRLVMRALRAADKGHVGSALSMIEIFRALYESVARHDPANPKWEGRDRIILSKGHGCLALYALLADQGYIDLAALDRFCERDALLGGHPERDPEHGIEASTGALGHGLPLAVGMAIAHKRKASGVRVFVVVGDGELDEGSNWEALLIAAKYKLANLTMIVDNNSEQISGSLDTVLPIEPLREKFESFGLITANVDGHDLASVVEALVRVSSRVQGPPAAVICHTIKGKGVSFAEQNPQWHYKRGLDPKTLAHLDEELASARQIGSPAGTER